MKKEEFNFTFEEAVIYDILGMLPDRVIPIIAKKYAEEVDKQIMEALENEKGKL